MPLIKQQKVIHNFSNIVERDDKFGASLKDVDFGEFIGAKKLIFSMKRSFLNYAKMLNDFILMLTFKYYK